MSGNHFLPIHAGADIVVETTERGCRIHSVARHDRFYRGRLAVWPDSGDDPRAPRPRVKVVDGFQAEPEQPEIPAGTVVVDRVHLFQPEPDDPSVRLERETFRVTVKPAFNLPLAGAVTQIVLRLQLNHGSGGDPENRFTDLEGNSLHVTAEILAGSGQPDPKPHQALIPLATVMRDSATGGLAFSQHNHGEPRVLIEAVGYDAELISSSSSGSESSSGSLLSESASHPSESASFPSESASHPTESASFPSESASHPTESASFPSESASHPTESASFPSESASHPTESASFPSESASHPTESASFPSESASHPMESASFPTESASHPTESASFPSESASVPSESASVPSESASHSTESASLPSESASGTDPVPSVSAGDLSSSQSASGSSVASDNSLSGSRSGSSESLQILDGAHYILCRIEFNGSADCSSGMVSRKPVIAKAPFAFPRGCADTSSSNPATPSSASNWVLAGPFASLTEAMDSLYGNYEGYELFCPPIEEGQ